MDRASVSYGRGVAGQGFELVCEIEPPTRPDLTRVRHQIGVLSAVAGTFLVPDNHLGRATVSSIAVAREVQAMGGRSIACLNSRDRNLLGFRRDLLTAAAYGVDQFLFVYGDKPSSGDRTSDLTVRAMVEEVRSIAEDPAFAGTGPFRVGVAAGLRPLAPWKRDGGLRLRPGALLARRAAAVAGHAGACDVSGLRRGDGARQRRHGDAGWRPRSPTSRSRTGWSSR